MSTSINPKLSGQLFIVSGVAFLAAGVIGEQVAFYALGAALIAMGAVHLRKAKRAG